MVLPFNNESERTQAANHFRSLVHTPGWQTMLTVIDFNIGVITEMILTGVGSEGEQLTEGEIRDLRKDLGHWRNFKTLPSTTVQELEEVALAHETDDPYATADELTST